MKDDMKDDDGTAMFAFQHLDYIPFGLSSSEAPYIESGPGIMRAAATLMRLTLGPTSTSQNLASAVVEPVATVVCDLGCGDGKFRTKNSALTGLLNPPLVYWKDNV